MCNFASIALNGYIKARIEEKVADIVGYNPEFYGAIPNNSDPVVAAKNLEIFYNLSLKGPIVIDNKYYWGGATQYTLTQNFVLLGHGSAEIEILTGCNPFIIGGNISLIKVSGIKMITAATTSKLVFSGNGSVDFKVSRFEATDCEFDGNLSLLYWNAGITTNPANNIYGIDELFILRNKITNVLKSYFITCNDLPMQKASICDNYVRNFSYSIFYSGIDNAHSYPTEISAARVLCIVKNNDVKNDTSTFGNTNSTYFVFTLFEGVRMEYTGNTVRNLITKGANIATYDQYSTCTDVLIYENNIWENILCTHSTTQYNEMIKSKASLNIICKNNYFKIDPDYITSLSESLSYAWCYMHIGVSMHNNLIIENNIFDVYDLRLMSSGEDLKNVVIKNNTFKTSLYSGTLAYYKISNSDIHSSSTIIVQGNTLDISDNVTNNVGLARMSDSSSGVYRPKELIVKDNIIKGSWAYAVYNPIAEVIDISNNTFHSNFVTASTSRDGIIYSDSFTNGRLANHLICKNNSLYSTKRIMPYPNMVFGGCMMDYENSFYGKSYQLQLNIVKYDTTMTTKSITIKLNYQEASAKKDCEIRCILGYDIGQDRNYLKFPSTDGTIQTIYLNRGTGGDTYVTGDNTAIYVYGLNNSSDSKVTCKIDNETSLVAISIASTPTQDDLCYYKTSVIISEGESMNLPIPETTVTYDPPSLADGEGVTTTVALTGAVLGDLVVASFNKDLAGITLSAYVSSANTVSVRFQNESGGVVDLASGTLKVRLIKM